VGQKTHPLGFRLGITQKHKSTWYSNLSEYSLLLEEDDKIRTYLKPFIQTASISEINIHRNSRGDQIEINIETARPGILVGKGGVGIEILSANIKRILPNDRQIRINVTEIENADLNASLLGDYVAEQLQKRIAFRLLLEKQCNELKLQKHEVLKFKYPVV